MIIKFHPNNKYFKEFEYSIELIQDSKLENIELYFQTVEELEKTEQLLRLYFAKNLKYYSKYILNNKKVLFNTEQLSRSFWFEKIKYFSNHIPILDYSFVNISIIKNNNPNSKCVLLPILFNKEKMVFQNFPKKEYDVIFIGFLSPKRKYIIDLLIQEKIKVLVLENEFDFDTKYNKIMKAKIVLNIHANDDYKIFEFARCSIPVFNSQIVISENSLIKDEIEGSIINKTVLDNVIFTEYKDLVNTVKKVLENYESFKYNLDYNFLEEITKIEIKNIIQNLISFVS